MKTKSLLLLAVLAGVLTACNNEEQSAEKAQPVKLNSTPVESKDATTAAPAQSATPAPVRSMQAIPQAATAAAAPPETALVRALNPAPVSLASTMAATKQQIQALLPNDIFVSATPVNFIYPNASVVVSKSREDINLYSLHLIGKLTGQGLNQHLLQRFPPEGDEPEFPLIFTVNADQDEAQELVVVPRWHILHRGMGIDANFYQPLVFDNVIDPNTKEIVRMEAIIAALGEGYDGRMEQGNETYAYKDRASLQRKIEAIR